MDCKLTPEICETINTTANSLFYKIGLWWFLAILLVGFLFYFALQRYLSKRLKKYETDLERAKTKDIELWKQQKSLMFNFVKFLEEKLFNNPGLKKEDPKKLEEVKSKIFAEMNIYYGQLYLVMETGILEKINECIQGTTSMVQRYYLYKELRKQLMSILHQKFTDEDCPHIEGEPTRTLIFSESNGKKTSRPAKSMDELKKGYPFIKELPNQKYKTLPFFGEKG